MLWELVEWQRNPMQLVEVKGISKRRKKPIVLTVEQYYQILALIPEPYRTMVVAQCTCLRAEEVLALEGDDIDFETCTCGVVRAVVHGRVKWVKTEYSGDELPCAEVRSGEGLLGPAPPAATATAGPGTPPSRLQRSQSPRRLG